MDSQFWISILSASGAAVIVSGVISGLFALRTKQREYVNDYYKLVLQRRIEAYEQVEDLIVPLKTSVADPSDRKLYHLPFAMNSDEGKVRVLALVKDVMDRGLWLSDEVFRTARKLNFIFFRIDKATDTITFGKENYEAIATLRTKLERLVAVDMLSLHKVKRFLKSKDRDDPGFSPVDLG